jgi:hypothetical protein
MKTIFDDLKKKNVAKAIVYFDGGNDDGGVSSIKLLDKENKLIETSIDENLEEELGNPIYFKYGSFAGEFYVSGELVYDVETKEMTWNNVNEESTCEYED